MPPRVQVYFNEGQLMRKCPVASAESAARDLPKECDYDKCSNRRVAKGDAAGPERRGKRHDDAARPANDRIHDDQIAYTTIKEPSRVAKSHTTPNPIRQRPRNREAPLTAP